MPVIPVVNGVQLYDDEETFIGWCGGGLNKRKFFILNAGLPCEQYRIEKTADSESSDSFIGFDVSEDGFVTDRGGISQCWEDIQIMGACWVPHGQNCHLYFLVTWLGRPEDRYAATLGALTKLRRSHDPERSKRVTKAVVLDRVKTWATEKRYVEGFDESRQQPHQVLDIYNQRRKLADHNAQGPTVGRTFGSVPPEAPRFTGQNNSAANGSMGFNARRRQRANVQTSTTPPGSASGPRNTYVSYQEFSDLTRSVNELKDMFMQFMGNQNRRSASEPVGFDSMQEGQSRRHQQAEQSERQRAKRGKQKAMEEPLDGADWASDHAAETIYLRQQGLDSEYPSQYQ
ncbi:hypothetical protein Dda_6986 [Drechslerella dactyloides]|uniref:Uncharacterized protein n=1 Tax=Drechslerella dactyloides TaxID=74499 RepID=A0AAD6IT64_DREDA|nr:hypothetical protein Dda_6986 [Drechslerella dactyloides]